MNERRGTQLERPREMAEQESIDSARKRPETMVRSRSYVVETPTFSFDSVSTETSIAYLASNENSDRRSEMNSDRTGASSNTLVSDKWQRESQLRFSSTSLSPVINDRFTNILQRCGDCVGEIGLNVEVVEQQLIGLNEMRCMLKEYHCLQLENLRMRQDQERQTLEIQIAYMSSLRDKLKKMRLSNANPRKHGESSPKSPPSDDKQSSYYLNTNPQKVLREKPVLSSQGKVFCRRHKECVPAGAGRREPSAHIPKALKLRLAALVKGFLTRRLLRTAAVQRIRRSVRDHWAQLGALKGKDELADHELQYKRVLVYQLQTALIDIHRIFFVIPNRERMVIISEDRRMLKERISQSINGGSQAVLQAPKQMTVGRKQPVKNPRLRMANSVTSKSTSSLMTEAKNQRNCWTLERKSAGHVRLHSSNARSVGSNSSGIGTKPKKNGVNNVSATARKPWR